MLKYIEDTLLKNWNGYGGFEELQEKILRLRMILEETDGKATAQGDGYSKRRGFALIIGSLSLTTFIPNQFETILFYPQYSKPNSTKNQTTTLSSKQTPNYERYT